MKELEEKILKDGIVIDNEILKIDSFINHQIDVELLNKICKEIASNFSNIDKIVTIETSGIAYAIGVAQYLGNIPVVFAKKSKSLITGTNVYTSEVKSFTRKTSSTITIDKRYITEGGNYLIIDDFLAEGNAALGLIDIILQAKGNIKGVGVVVEKRFQGGRVRIEEKGIKVISTASIKEFKDNKPVFVD